MDRRVTLGVRTSWLVIAACVFAAPLNLYGQSLPGGWSTRDIGSVGASGSASGSGGSFTVRGSGADVWGTADGFRFVYRQLTGDGEIVTRVNSIDYVHAWAKAGVMMRESLDAGARHAFMLASPGKGIAFQRRPSAYGESVNTGTGGGAGAFLKITRSGNNFDAYMSWDGSSWEWVASEWIDMPGTIYAGVAVTSHYYGALAGATFSHTVVNEAAVAPVAGGGLPSGWKNRDIGGVAAGGWAEAAGSDVRLNGSGADIWDAADEFQFMYRTLNGDGSITAQVTGLDYTDVWTKAGVMMRQSLTASAAHAFMLVSAGKGSAFQRRPWAGGASDHTAGPWAQAPYFVKLTRSGHTFTAYASQDGYNWSTVGSQYIEMDWTIYVGLAVTSHRDGAIAGANFSGVEVTEGGVAAPAPQPEPEPIQETPAPVEPPVESVVETGSGGTSLRVLHWNVHHLIGTDGVFDPGRIAYWIARMNADIISLNEIDNEWMAVEITNAIAAHTGRHWNTAWSGWGNLVLTTLPLHGSSVCSFNPGAGRVAAHLSTSFNGRAINVWSAHLATDGGDTRYYEVSNLQACASGWSGARLIAGDFNMQASSSEYGLATYGYSDGWATAKANGATANYSGNCDGCTRNSRIDYIFSSHNAWFLTVQSAEVIDTRDGYGNMPSDHKPLVVTYYVQ